MSSGHRGRSGSFAVSSRPASPKKSRLQGQRPPRSAGEFRGKFKAHVSGKSPMRRADRRRSSVTIECIPSAAAAALQRGLLRSGALEDGGARPRLRKHARPTADSRPSNETRSVAAEDATEKIRFSTPTPPRRPPLPIRRTSLTRAAVRVPAYDDRPKTWFPSSFLHPVSGGEAH